MTNILVYDADAERIKELAKSYGVSVADFVEALVDDCEYNDCFSWHFDYLKEGE